MSLDWNHTPLLSKKPLSEFTPEEYKSYVRSLYHKAEPKRKASVKKAPKPAVTWRLNAKGTLIVMIKRDPKWISREELEKISAESAIDFAKVWLHVVTKKKVRVSTQEDEDQIKASQEEIPW